MITCVSKEGSECFRPCAVAWVGVRCGRRKRGAFTLVELLVVVTIIALLLAAIVSGVRVTRGRDISNGGTMMMENLSLARELAVAGNHSMEVWFVQPTGDATNTFINALQVFSVDVNGNSTPYTEIQRLPVSVGIDSGSILSNIFTTTYAAPTVTPPPIAGYGTNGTSYNAWVVRFLPDGSTTLTAAKNWYLTLHERVRGDGLSAARLQAGIDYAVVGVNPSTGKANLYRP